MESRLQRSLSTPGATAFLGGVAVFAVFLMYCEVYWWSPRLGLGSIDVPALQHGYFLAFAVLFESLAVGLCAYGLAQLSARPQFREWVLSRWTAGADRRWMLALAALAFGLALAVRAAALRGTPVTDDEGAYLFLAELLARGRVVAPDDHGLGSLLAHEHMVVDGGVRYPAVLLGWPLLMVPGALVGAPGYMSAVLAALGVPAVFDVLRRVSSSAWARLGTLIYAASPMLMIAGGTAQPHTASLVILIWLTWLVHRTGEPDVRPWLGAAFAGLLGLWLLVRPLSALTLGTVLAVVWVARGWRSDRRGLIVAAVAAIAVLGGWAAIAAATNVAQTGVAWQPAPVRARALAMGEAVDFVTVVGSVLGHELHGSGAGAVRGALGAVVLRMNMDLFGWASSLVFVPFAIWARPARLAWALLGCILLVRTSSPVIGIDVFGPARYFEAAWPLLVLTILGLRTCTEFLRAHGRPATTGGAHMAALPIAAAATMMLMSYPGYTRFRVDGAFRMRRSAMAPATIVRGVEVERAVLFGPAQWLPDGCRKHWMPHFLSARPVASVDLDEDLVWLASGTPQAREAALAAFPGRPGYEVSWREDCTLELTALLDAPPVHVPTREEIEEQREDRKNARKGARKAARAGQSGRGGESGQGGDSTTSGQGTSATSGE